VPSLDQDGLAAELTDLDGKPGPAHEGDPQQRRPSATTSDALRAVFDAIAVPSALLCAVRNGSGVIVDFVYVEVNAAACKHLGASRDQLVGARYTEMSPGPAASHLLARYADVVDSRKPLLVDDFVAEPELVGETPRRYDIRAAPVGDGLSCSWLDVTDRFEARRELAEREERFRFYAAESEAARVMLRATMDAMLDPLIVVEPVRDESGLIVDFVHIDANAAACAYHGVSLAQLRRRRLGDMVAPRTRVETMGICARAVTSGQPIVLNGFPFALAATDEMGYIDVRGTVADGRLTLTWRDVTADFQTQEALRESERRYRILVENSVDVVFELIEGVISWISPSIEALLGWRPEELVGNFPEELWHPLQAEAPRLLQEATGRGEGTYGVYRLRSRRGSYRWLEITTHPYGERAGAAGATGSMRDVTAQREAEEALETSEERFRLIAESALDVVIATTVAGGITWVSPSVSETLGWDPAALVGRQITSLVHPDDVEEVMAERRRVLSEGRDRGDAEVRYATGSGRWRWMQVVARPVRDHTGRITAGIETLRDIQSEIDARTELRFQADHDRLTGLANRAGAVSWLDEALSSDLAQAALLCVAVDDLKEINDALTYTAGDRVLMAVAERLGAVIGGNENVARSAENEFALLLRGAPADADLVNLATAVQIAMQTPVAMGSHDIHLTVSIGMATASGGRGVDLLRDGSSALHQAKAKGGNRWEFLDPEASHGARQRLLVRTGLRDALAAGEIRAFYQPVVSLADGQLRGYEALARWVRPDGTMVPPASFVPVAEHTDLIVNLDRLILRHALEALAELPAHLHLAVNTAAATVSSADLVDSVHHELSRTGIEPHRLSLEVTETSLVEVTPEVQSAMRTLALMGVTWWVDDFGTGYSSVSLLRDLPIGGLKLDRSFTTGINTDTTRLHLARALAGLASGLGLQTVAEGIETAEEGATLAGQGWEMGQGWLYGRPSPAPPV